MNIGTGRIFLLPIAFSALILRVLKLTVLRWSKIKEETRDTVKHYDHCCGFGKEASVYPTTYQSNCNTLHHEPRDKNQRKH
jgi:hypothetical protein